MATTTTTTLHSSNPPIVFTRYLYVKDEVFATLLIKLLHEDTSAIYWAYELYFSGFEEELFTYLIKIYYDFYYTFNLDMLSVIITKYKKWKCERYDEVIREIVQLFLLRPFTFDMFIIGINFTTIHLTKKEEEEEDCLLHDPQDPKQLTTIRKKQAMEFKNMMETNSFIGVSYIVLNAKTDMERILYLTLTIRYINDNVDEPLMNNNNKLMDMEKTITQFTKTMGVLGIQKNIQLMAFILAHLTPVPSHQTPHNNELEEEEEEEEEEDRDETDSYSTPDPAKTNIHYKTLTSLKIKSMKDHVDYMRLFQLGRDAMSYSELQEKYRHDWLYYASFSPIWSRRIAEYGGKIDHGLQKVHFSNDDDDDMEQSFYKLYGYEPDEQPIYIQDKNIPEMDIKSIININKNTVYNNKSWFTVYNKEDIIPYTPFTSLNIDILKKTTNVKYT